jgi:hypothetical protein
MVIKGDEVKVVDLIPLALTAFGSNLVGNWMCVMLSNYSGKVGLGRCCYMWFMTMVFYIQLLQHHFFVMVIATLYM